ncbi:MAG: serine/threonine-protein kinase [Planctomycetaceae bacterium]
MSDLSADDRDARLAGLLEELLARIRRGEGVELRDVIGEHADLEADLRELWGTVRFAEDFAEASLSIADDELDSASAQRSPRELPRRIGEYELLEELGRGGMGVVYLARQPSLDRVVALKMVLRGELASAEDRERFKREAEAAAKLDHPHVVPVYEVGSWDGQPFFSMKHVAGTTLARRLANGPLPPRSAAALMVPICRAIAEAHRRGLLHRDIKPSNILIDAAGVPYVTDFGLVGRIADPSHIVGQAFQPADPSGVGQAFQPAGSSGVGQAFQPAGPSGVGQAFQPADPSGVGQAFQPAGSTARSQSRADKDVCPTHTGAILGTPAYMSPEQASGDRGRLGPASDVYSLGAVLYAALCGRPPFQAPTAAATVLAVLEEDPVPPRVLDRHIDPDLEMIVLKCLQKPADLRYPHADALADDLESWLAGEPVAARSSRFSDVLDRAFRETHHATVLENWGVLWMWHSLVLLVLCLVTNAMQLGGVASRWPYVAIWGCGLLVWAAFFWNLRRRSGPVTFVERQIAHVWAGSVASSVLLFFVEAALGLPVLALSPVLGLVSGMVFLVKAGILSGRFYLEAAALFATGLGMALWRSNIQPDLSITLFGLVSAACFFFPGLKYDRQRRAARR